MSVFNTGSSKAKIKKCGLIQHFILFNNVCSPTQLTKMNLLRDRLKAVGNNPLQNIKERMAITREILLLRRETSATVTSDMLDFNEIVWSS